MSQDIRTAIFPVAGMGTRFLPATKATPKELLPVIDTPLIQYAIDEAKAAGIERLVFVSHPSKEAIRRYVMDDRALRSTLKDRGKDDLARQLEEAALEPKEDDVVFTMQDEPLGLGHAVLCARDHVLPGPVAVILPDDLILGEPGCLNEMIAAYRVSGVGHMVAAMTVPNAETSKYGILSVTKKLQNILPAVGIVEKPQPADAPSNEAVVGRYLLDASIFDDLAGLAPGAGGEIQLTDAIASGIKRVGLAGFRFSGRRFDCGSKSGMLDATLHLAAQNQAYAEILNKHGLTSIASAA